MKNKSELCSTDHDTGVIQRAPLRQMLRKKRIRTNPTPGRKGLLLRQYKRQVLELEGERQKLLEMSQQAWAERRIAETRSLVKEGWRRLKIWMGKFRRKPKQS